MLQPIFIHCRPDESFSPRFDTVMMVNGTVAVLSQVGRMLTGRSCPAIDLSYSSIERVHECIRHALSQQRVPLALATVLGYNAAGTLRLLSDLKRQYGRHIRTGVGGQQVPYALPAFLSKPFLDHVAVGDAEAALPRILQDERLVEAWLTPDATHHYALPCYEDYVDLEPRLAEMSGYRLGPFQGIRQLVTESVRGCAWAYQNGQGACRMCALQSVDSKPQFRPLDEHFALERHLYERFGINWMFDVSNQWLPDLRAKGKMEFLESYVSQREREGVTDLQYYAYLTSSSVTSETAPLLRRAGIRVAYVGLDGWDYSTRSLLNKPRNDPDRFFRACLDNDLYVRAGLVVGLGANQKNLSRLEPFVERLIRLYGSHLLSVDVNVQITIPGSLAWKDFRAKALREDSKEALELFALSDRDGFLSWTDQRRLDALYVARYIPDCTYAELEAACESALTLIRSSLHTTAVQVDDGGVFRMI